MSIYNLGSINIDHLYMVDGFPEPGETLSAKQYMASIGGKGLNISVAASRSGADVRHIGLVGAKDTSVRDRIADLGLDDRHIANVDTETGHAIIYLDGQSENCIVVHGGANQCFTEPMIRKALKDAKSTDWLVLQNETNANTIGIKVAREKGMKVALVAAPFDEKTMPDMIAQVDLVSMNKVESELFEATIGMSIKDCRAQEFLITYGKKGAMFLSGSQEQHIDSYKVRAVDATGAGDTFFGVFIAAYSSGNSVETALKNANAAGALMVQRRGTASVVPTKVEIKHFAKQYGNSDISVEQVRLTIQERAIADE